MMTKTLNTQSLTLIFARADQAPVQINVADIAAISVVKNTDIHSLHMKNGDTHFAVAGPAADTLARMDVKTISMRAPFGDVVHIVADAIESVGPNARCEDDSIRVGVMGGHTLPVLGQQKDLFQKLVR
ncbi:hypothetical protein [Micavibrio aeruginosavorus]|uniref:hypothetical protein n=1 Tax=Micavibrio aeruginosavorus TaxID=349221 RepID=UPI003F4AAAE5